MASKKAGGSTRNGRDSKGQRLGVKMFGGQSVISGNIIVRQRGTKFFPGVNVKMGRDFTIYSVIEGKIQFERVDKHKIKISVYPRAEEATASKTAAA